jgi:hypothetical protein
MINMRIYKRYSLDSSSVSENPYSNSKATSEKDPGYLTILQTGKHVDLYKSFMLSLKRDNFKVSVITIGILHRYIF